MRITNPIHRALPSLGFTVAVALFLCVMRTGWGEDVNEIAELKALLMETRDAMRAMEATYEKRIDILEARIGELESDAAEAGETQEALASASVEQQTLLEEVQSDVRDRISIHGYYDFQYIDADSDVVGSFIQNELSIFLRSSTEDEQWTIFSELEFERIDGNDYLAGRGDESGDLEIETAWLEYRHSDRLRIRGGKLLLPQYWQTYHYPNLTLATIPPLMVGKVFPKSIVAVQLSGAWWTRNDRGVSYALYGGNGGEADGQDLDENDSKAFGGRLTFNLAGRNKPDWLDTLDVSVSAYLGDYETGNNDLILGVDAQIRIRRLELLAELAHGEEAHLDFGRFRPFYHRSGESLGYYIQSAYRLAPEWQAFYRYDYLDLNNRGRTPFDEERHTVGVNFRPRPNISLKLEFFHGEPETRDEDFNGLASSVVFNF